MHLHTINKGKSSWINPSQTALHTSECGHHCYGDSEQFGVSKTAKL